MAYALDQIRVEGMKLKELGELKIECRPGEHGSLSLSGILVEDSATNTLYELKEHAPISVSILEEGTKKILFSGRITTASVNGYGDFRCIKLEAKTHSLLMDLKKKSRSFQDTAMTYGQVIKAVMADYPGSDIKLSIPDKPLGEIAVQYRETDWAFCKRMLSLFQTKLSCHSAMEQIKLYGGIPSMSQETFSYQRRKVEKELGEYNYWQQQGVDVSDIDFLIYTIEIEKEHTPELFEQVVYLGKPFTIRNYTYSLEQGLLYCRCELQKQTGILEPKQYPMHLIGVALEGKILDIAGDQVKIQLLMDEGYGSQSVYWFPYSTLSASPDGSGWYYMPERGDSVRIYFPSKYTRDVIAISSVSDYDGKSESEPDRMGSPSTKYLSNASGQELSLAENGIHLKCAKGAASLTIGNDGKVSLWGENEMMVGAQNNITITAETDVILHGSKNVSILCSQGGQIQAAEDGNLYIRGTEVMVD